jgi:hypothetical protein
MKPLLLIALLALGACAPPRVDFSETLRVYHASDYTSVRDRWTRQGTLYKGVSSLVFLTATYKSWEWRQAYLATMRDNAALTPTEYQELVAKERAAYNTGHEFFISVAMPIHRWAANLAAKDSQWHITLVNSRGEEVHPEKIERFRRVTPNITEFFSYHTTFGEAYVLRFPRTLPDGRPVLDAQPPMAMLRLAGPPGKAELVWQAAK